MNSVRKAKGNETFDVTAYLLHETKDAYLISEQDPADAPAHKRKNEWVPKSLTDKGKRVAAGIFEFTLPEWLAVKKGFA